MVHWFRCIQHLCWVLLQLHEIGIWPFPGPASRWDCNPGWHFWLHFEMPWHQGHLKLCLDSWPTETAWFWATMFVVICYTALINTKGFSRQRHFGRTGIDWKIELRETWEKGGDIPGLGNGWPVAIPEGSWNRVPDIPGEAGRELIREGLRGVCKARRRENHGGSRGIMKQWEKHTSSNI